MKLFKLQLILLTAAFLIFSCSLPTQKDSQEESDTEFDRQAWDDYRQEHVVPSGSGYLVEGDLKVSSLDEVKDYFARMSGIESQRSTVHLNDDGEWDVWNETEKNNLTYTVDGFADNAAVRNLLAEACASWEAAADIDFIDITGTGQTPLFIVRPATAAEETANPSTEASAFFPHYFDRELVFYQRWLSYGSDEQLSIAKHKLGHILGLRHEHIWHRYWEDGGYVTEQVEEILDPAELITAYDQRSIMFYDWKSGYSGDGDLSLYDIVGIMTLYSQKPVLPDGYYTIRSVYNDRYLEVPQNSPGFDRVYYGSGNGMMNQKWLLRHQSDGYYTLTSCSSGYLMYKEYPYIEEGLKSYYPLDDLEFLLQLNPDGSFFIRPRNLITHSLKASSNTDPSAVSLGYEMDFDDVYNLTYTLWRIESASVANNFVPIGEILSVSETAVTGTASDGDCQTSIRIDAFVDGILVASTITDPDTGEFVFDVEDLFPGNDIYQYEIWAVDSSAAVERWEPLYGIAVTYGSPAINGMDMIIGSGEYDNRAIEDGSSYILYNDLKTVRDMKYFPNLSSQSYRSHLQGAYWSSRNPIVLDVNGDGRDDLFMQAKDNSDVSTIFVSRTDNDIAYNDHFMKDFADWGENSSWANRIPYVLDVNGDGKDDLFMQWFEPSSKYANMLFIARQDGSGFDAIDIKDFAGWGEHGSWSSRKPTVLDVNGDEKDDLLMQWPDGSPDHDSILFITNETGDGFYRHDIKVFAGWGTNGSWANRIPYVLDINGDEKDDLLMQWFEPSSQNACMLFIANADGSGFSYSNIKDYMGWGENGSWTSRKPYILDVNGDNRDDIYIQWPVASDSHSNTLCISKTNGAGFLLRDIKVYANWGDNATWASRTPIILDIDGDDKDEIFLQWND